MRPDYLFVVPAVLIMLWSVITVAKQRDAQGLRDGAIWMVLGVGLLIQGLAPHLQISGKVVEVPVSYTGGAPKVELELVQRERTMMMASSICIVAALVALGLRYKGLLAGTGAAVTTER